MALQNGAHWSEDLLVLISIQPFDNRLFTSIFEILIGLKILHEDMSIIIKN
jgi:hypothetical protein